jgi:hypothetical protein
MTAQTLLYRCPHCNQPVDVDLHHENDLLVCPNPDCQKPFKVDVPTAHPTTEMQFAQESAEVQHAAAAPAVVLAPVPPPAEVPETVVQTVRLAMLRRYPFRCLAYTILTLAGLIAFIYFMVTDRYIVGLMCLGLGAAVLFRFILWHLHMSNTVFTITNRKCDLESGIFTKKHTELALSEIQDIQVSQTFVQGIMDVGDLVLVNKKGDAQRVIIMAVPSPKEVAQQIHALHPH